MKEGGKKREDGGSVKLKEEVLSFETALSLEGGELCVEEEKRGIIFLRGIFLPKKERGEKSLILGGGGCLLSSREGEARGRRFLLRGGRGARLLLAEASIHR